jgi:hypothetical protein
MFQLLPVIQAPYEKLHILEMLYYLFRNGGYSAKKSFCDVNTHFFLQSYLSKLIHQQDENFMKCTLDFLTDYLNFAIFELDKDVAMGKNGLEYLSEVLQGLMVLEGEHTSWFVQNLQRSIMHGIMMNFQKEHLFVSHHENTPRGASKRDKKRRTKLDSLFATFCACAVDYIVQWSYLPPVTPHRTVSIEQLVPEEDEYNEDEILQSSHESDEDIDEETNFKVDVINDHFAANSLKEQHHFPSSSPPVSNSVFRKMEFDTTGVSVEIDELIYDYESKQCPAARIWYVYEKKRMLNLNKDKRRISSDPFCIRYDQITGFIYWFVESIQLCLQHRKGTNFEFYGIMSNAEFVLLEQLKRLFLYLSDIKRSTADNIFALLNLLFFYPLDSTNIIVQLLRNNDLSTDVDETHPSQQSSQAGVTSTLLPCGKIIEDFSSDEKFIKRLIFYTAKLFSKPNTDPLLVHLNRKVSPF